MHQLSDRSFRVPYKFAFTLHLTAVTLLLNVFFYFGEKSKLTPNFKCQSNISIHLYEVNNLQEHRF